MNGNEAESGSAVVEACIVLSALLFLVAALLDLGILLYDSFHLTAIAREGARASVQLDALQADDARLGALINDWTGKRLAAMGNVAVHNTPLASLAGIVDKSGNVCDAFTTVTVSADYRPFFAAMIGMNKISVVRKASMRYQRQVPCS